MLSLMPPSMITQTEQINQDITVLQECKWPVKQYARCYSDPEEQVRSSLASMHDSARAHHQRPLIYALFDSHVFQEDQEPADDMTFQASQSQSQFLPHAVCPIVMPGQNKSLPSKAPSLHNSRTWLNMQSQASKRIWVCSRILMNTDGEELHEFTVMVSDPLQGLNECCVERLYFPGTGGVKVSPRHDTIGVRYANFSGTGTNRFFLTFEIPACAKLVYDSLYKAQAWTPSEWRKKRPCSEELMIVPILQREEKVNEVVKDSQEVSASPILFSPATQTATQTIEATRTTLTTTTTVSETVIRKPKRPKYKKIAPSPAEKIVEIQRSSETKTIANRIGSLILDEGLPATSMPSPIATTSISLNAFTLRDIVEEVSFSISHQKSNAIPEIVEIGSQNQNPNHDEDLNLCFTSLELFLSNEERRVDLLEEILSERKDPPIVEVIPDLLQEVKLEPRSEAEEFDFLRQDSYDKFKE